MVCRLCAKPGPEQLSGHAIFAAEPAAPAETSGKLPSAGLPTKLLCTHIRTNLIAVCLHNAMCEINVKLRSYPDPSTCVETQGPGCSSVSIMYRPALLI